MAIRQATITISGISPLLQNNPQTVDPFNPYAKAKKALTDKGRRKTEDDLIEIGNIETRSKLYFDDQVGVYVPARWLTEAIVTAAFGTIKIGKDKMRGGVFSTEDKIALRYDGIEQVKTADDVIYNPKFRLRMGIPQGKDRVAKDWPIFHGWSFGTVIEFDDSVADFNGIKRIVEKTAKYVGFGDFRPTFGRAIAEVHEA